MADHFLAFYNAAIIAYGQTGSGKTHTMLGNLPSDWASRSLSNGCFEDMPREAGLIPRVLGYIFQRVGAESNDGSSQKAVARQLAQRPPAATQACTTPVADPVRPRGRSGIPTPSGMQRAPFLTPPPASPKLTPEPTHAPKPPSGPASRNKLASAGNTEYLIKASMLQIYQEVVTDLLNPKSARLQIRESMEGGVMVVGLSEVTVRSAPEALQLLRLGTSHRAVAETASNPVSSRSHCILTLHMEAKDKLDTGVIRIRRSRLQLVDLAGSERTAKGVDHGSARQRETNAINKSLSTLGLVISRLTDRTRSQGPVPYRDSKLTFLLQDCLGGNAKTLIIANLNPSPTCSSETNMTLGFALRAKRVRNRAVVNEDHQGDAVVLQGEVRRLREELSIFRTLHAKDAPPKGIAALSAWRDETAARSSQLHQALQLNGELEEKLAQMDAAHSRLRMEHVTLEEQCNSMRCEMSALEATVEQCEDELHELRARPTFEQLQAVEEQLRTTISERDEARARYAHAVDQNLQLQEQCVQLSALLRAHQNQQQAAEQAGQGQYESPGFAYDGPGDLVFAGTVLPNPDHTALERTYADLKRSYSALVEQNQQLLLQLNAAASTLEEASAADAGPALEPTAQRDTCVGSQPAQRHRYHLADSCLVSGGLEAVMEAVDEDFNSESPKQNSPPAESLNEQVRLASPTSPRGSTGQEAGTTAAEDPARPSSALSPPAQRAEQYVETFNQMRRRCRSQGSGPDAAAADTCQGILRRSISGLPDGLLTGHLSCDSAPSAVSLTNIRQLGRLAYSGLHCDVNGAIVEENGGDNRSLGTLVRVNPLFECRNGEERPSTADREVGSIVVEATSTQAPKSVGSAEAPVESDSLVCELPMPPEEPQVETSPWQQGTYYPNAVSGSSDSTAGTVRNGSGASGQPEHSVTSDARDRALREIQSPNMVVAAAAELRRSSKGLQTEPSLQVTPCSHPTWADGERGSGVQPHSPRVTADRCDAAAEGSPSLEFKFDGFAGRATATTQSISKTSTPSRAAHSPLRSSSPLLARSLYNNENESAPFSNVAWSPQASVASRGKSQRASYTAQSLFIKGVSAPSLGFQYSRDRSRTTTTAISPVSKSVATSACATVGGGQAGLPAEGNSEGARGNTVSCGSPQTEQRAEPLLTQEQLTENVEWLEEELDRRLKGEMQLRVKLQEALTDAQTHKSQATNLLALNNNLVEEVAERDERLRCFENMVARLYSEMKAILRQGYHELATPVPHARTVTTGGPSTAECEAAADSQVPAGAVPMDNDPATASPAERPRVIQSFETGTGSPFSFGADATPQDPVLRPPADGSACPTPMWSRGSRESCDADQVYSPLGLMVGTVHLEGPNSVLKAGLMLLLAKLRDGLLERDQHVAALEAELGEARSRLECVELKLQKMEHACPRSASPQPAMDGGPGCTNETADTDARGSIDTALVDVDCIDEHGFIAPPSPACSDSDPRPAAPWSAGRQPSRSTPPVSSASKREAGLQAQLQNRDRQVFDLLERIEQLEAFSQAALVERDSNVTQATRLANSLQTQLWAREAQVTELQNRVAELDALLQRATAEAARYRAQSTEAEEQCRRSFLELSGLERREALLIEKIRELERSFEQRGQELDSLRAELVRMNDQLVGMRAKEMDAAHIRQTAAGLEAQLPDLRRSVRLAQQQPQFQQLPPSHYVATVRPTGVSAGGAAPCAWPPGQGSQGPYLYGSRSDGGAAGGPAMAYQVPGRAHGGFGPVAPEMGPLPTESRPLWHPSSAYSHVVPPAAPMKPVGNHGSAKGGASRGHAPAPAAAGAALDHVGKKGTWVQRFLCRKAETTSPGQETQQHIAILTPSKWRAKGMKGMVVRQWVGNASGKGTSRKAG